MLVLVAFLRYALLCIGWEVERLGTGTLLATDLHGVQHRITVIHEN